jgi:hypothetical protein
MMHNFFKTTKKNSSNHSPTELFPKYQKINS